MKNSLCALKAMTSVVADTGDIQAIQQCQPEDATTNPSLLLKAAKLPQYKTCIQSAIQWAKQQSNVPLKQAKDACVKLAVDIGCEILQIIPGRVSTEVDARLSFDTERSIMAAQQIVDLYAEQGISRDRILVKLAATWEGIQAARRLEQTGIACNLTLMFSMAQARACAEAGVTLVSPFVGRILDWHQQKTGATYTAKNDPGVLSVMEIYHYYKSHAYPTIVMGASFRNKEEVLALAGCDKLTVNPAFLQELQNCHEPVHCSLFYDGEIKPRPAMMTEAQFRWQLNQNEMATEKLAEGIRLFARDQEMLEQGLLASIQGL